MKARIEITEKRIRVLLSEAEELDRAGRAEEARERVKKAEALREKLAELHQRIEGSRPEKVHPQEARELEEILHGLELGMEALERLGRREELEILQQVARLLRAHDDIELVLVEAHTGRIGDLATNMQLSRARARAATDALVKLGIDRARLAPAGFGGTRPMDLADDTLNYRVEFVISSRSKRPNSVAHSELQAKETTIDVVLQSSRPLDPGKVTAHADGDQVLYVKVPGLDAAEEQLVARDQQVVRAFLLPDAEQASGAIIRIRYLNPVPDDMTTRVRVMVTGNRMRISFPRE